MQTRRWRRGRCSSCTPCPTRKTTAQAAAAAAPGKTTAHVLTRQICPILRVFTVLFANKMQNYVKSDILVWKTGKYKKGIGIALKTRYFCKTQKNRKYNAHTLQKYCVKRTRRAKKQKKKKNCPIWDLNPGPWAHKTHAITDLANGAYAVKSVRNTPLCVALV